MRKDVVIQNHIIIEISTESNTTLLMIYYNFDGKRTLREMIDLTPDECDKLGGALCSVATTDKRHKAARAMVDMETSK